MSSYDFPMPARGRRGRGPKTKRQARAARERRLLLDAPVVELRPDPRAFDTEPIAAMLRARRKAA